LFLLPLLTQQTVSNFAPPYSSPIGRSCDLGHVKSAVLRLLKFIQNRYRMAKIRQHKGSIYSCGLPPTTYLIEIKSFTNLCRNSSKGHILKVLTSSNNIYNKSDYKRNVCAETWPPFTVLYFITCRRRLVRPLSGYFWLHNRSALRTFSRRFGSSRA
jgi:hypothetical protein